MSRTARQPHLLCILLLSSISLAKTVAFLATVATWKTRTKFLKHKLTSSYSGSQQQQEGRSYSSLMDSAAREVLHTASSLFLGFGKKNKKTCKVFLYRLLDVQGPLPVCG